MPRFGRAARLQMMDWSQVSHVLAAFKARRCRDELLLNVRSNRYGQRRSRRGGRANWLLVRGETNMSMRPGDVKREGLKSGPAIEEWLRAIIDNIPMQAYSHLTNGERSWHLGNQVRLMTEYFAGFCLVGSRFETGLKRSSDGAEQARTSTISGALRKSCGTMSGSFDKSPTLSHKLSESSICKAR